MYLIITSSDHMSYSRDHEYFEKSPPQSFERTRQGFTTNMQSLPEDYRRIIEEIEDRRAKSKVRNH